MPICIDCLLNVIAVTPVSQWVSESVSQPVIDSFRFGDSYRISELCELVLIRKFTCHNHSHPYIICNPHPAGLRHGNTRKNLRQEEERLETGISSI